MAETVKIIGSETAMSNSVANNYGLHRVIRLTNTNAPGAANTVLIVQANSAAVNTGSFSLLPNTVIVVIKGASDTLLCVNSGALSLAANVFATPTGLLW